MMKVTMKWMMMVITTIMKIVLCLSIWPKTGASFNLYRLCSIARVSLSMVIPTVYTCSIKHLVNSYVLHLYQLHLTKKHTWTREIQRTICVQHLNKACLEFLYKYARVHVTIKTGARAGCLLVSVPNSHTSRNSNINPTSRVIYVLTISPWSTCKEASWGSYANLLNFPKFIFPWHGILST